MDVQRYFIALSYAGTPFHGWQIQPNASSVQEKLEHALSVYFRQQLQVVGCGRTDTGVHAKAYFAHVDIEAVALEKVLQSVVGLNALLPYEISILKIMPVHAEAHARFDATDRSYEYLFHYHKDPFKIDRSWLIKDNLDLDLMQQACEILKEYTDFSCFSKLHTQTFTNNCKIFEAYFEIQPQALVFHIKADRFLRNMVRAIVGTMVMLGRAEINLQQFRAIIESKNRALAGQSVPACGLYLSAVTYPYPLNEV